MYTILLEKYLIIIVCLFGWCFFWGVSLFGGGSYNRIGRSQTIAHSLSFRRWSSIVFHLMFSMNFTRIQNPINDCDWSQIATDSRFTQHRVGGVCTHSSSLKNFNWILAPSITAGLFSKFKSNQKKTNKWWFVVNFTRNIQRQKSCFGAEKKMIKPNRKQNRNRKEPKWNETENE